jgi:hypothetical protein
VFIRGFLNANAPDGPEAASADRPEPVVGQNLSLPASGINLNLFPVPVSGSFIYSSANVVGGAEPASGDSPEQLVGRNLSLLFSGINPNLFPVPVSGSSIYSSANDRCAAEPASGDSPHTLVRDLYHGSHFVTSPKTNNSFPPTLFQSCWHSRFDELVLTLFT